MWRDIVDLKLIIAYWHHIAIYMLNWVNIVSGHGLLFYHGVGEISDLSQSEAPNLVMWRVMVMQPRPRLLGDEVVVGPNLMFRKMDP